MERLPDAVYWRSLIYRINDPKLGFESLSDSEKLFYSVCELNGEVYNGGFEQYFTNSSAENLNYAIKGLTVMRDYISLEILKNVNSLLFGALPVPLNYETRLEFLSSNVDFESKTITKKLDEFDAEFIKNSNEILIYKIDEFAEVNQLYESIINNIQEVIVE